MDSNDNYQEEALPPQEEIRILAGEHTRLQQEVKALEVQLMRKESEVRRATEENALVRELQSINQLTLRKATTRGSDVNQPGRARISEESLAEVVALENKIKLEDKRTGELERAANVVSNKIEDIEQSIVVRSETIHEIKDATGWERDNCAARGYVNPTNLLNEKHIVLRGLEEKQNTYKMVLAQLSARIEELTMELEPSKDVEQRIQEVKQMLESKQKELGELADTKKSLENLLYKKEKLLKACETKDDYKVIKQLEGDKRVLHNDLSRCLESTVSNTKAILAQEVRLRQLEMKLDALARFLDEALAPDEEDSLPEGVAPDATHVSLELFEQIQRQLAETRFLVSKRDTELDVLDARVEQVETKVNILHLAIVTRTATAANEAQEMDREYNVISTHLEYMRSEFEQEHARLLLQHEELSAKLAAAESIA